MLGKFRTQFSTWNTNLSTFLRVSPGFIRTAITRYDPLIAKKPLRRVQLLKSQGYFRR